MAEAAQRRSRGEMTAGTTAKLVAAARAAFRTEGYAAASMDALCAEAGVTRGALYHHFGGKEGLLEAVVRQIDAEIGTRLDAEEARHPDPWDGFRACCHLWIEQALDPEVQRIYLLDADAFLDPPTFNPDSALGVPGIMDVYRAGNITIANAPGTGIADDKAIYSYMPEIIEFYTGRKAILENILTWRCSEPDSLKYVQEHLAELVVKEVHGSGGYGMLIGPAASKRELSEFAAKLRANPEGYIAQPTLALSTCPIFTSRGLAPRHLDLRPFVLVSPNKVDITPGGLTRVAMKPGSLVVNSSQGGGTKDTWVLKD